MTLYATSTIHKVASSLISSLASTNLGLINRTYPTDATFDPDGTKEQWQRLENYVRHLNSVAKDGESYKVMYVGRHGEGWHNVEEANVGGHLWDVS